MCKEDMPAKEDPYCRQGHVYVQPRALCVKCLGAVVRLFLKGRSEIRDGKILGTVSETALRETCGEGYKVALAVANSFRGIF